MTKRDRTSTMSDEQRSAVSGRHRPVVHVFVALLLWLGLGFSLGWYYTFTYYGHAGWPMPMVEVCASIILYYFSVLNVDTEIQAIHWMLVFPAAGALWATEVWHLARHFNRKRPSISQWFLQLSFSAVPIAIAGLAMAVFAGKTDSGFSAQRMMDVALRRGFVDPPDWLSLLYLVLAGLGLAWQVYVYRRNFPGSMFSGLMHTLVAALLTILAACIIGGIISIPMRLILE